MTYQSLRYPKSEEAERAILSILTFSPERFSEVVDILQPRDFSILTMQQIWSAMMSLYKQGVALDLVSISDELKKQEVKPEPAVEELFNVFDHPTVVGGNLDHFVNQVKNHSTLRKIITFTYEQLESAQEEGAVAENVLGKIETGVLDLADNVLERNSPEVSQIADEVDAEYEVTKKEGWKGLSTGMPSIDYVTGGFIKPQVWIVGAYTGVGKTFFALQMIINVLEQGGKVMLFSTEMDRKTNILRILGNLANVGTLKLLKADLTDEQRANRRIGLRKLKEWKDRLFIYDTVRTVEQIRLKAKKQILRGGLDMIVVDFIQNMQSPKGDSIYERMSEVAIDLQNLSKELNVVLVITSQVSQDAAGWKSKEAIDYKGAGEIAAVADVGIWITKGEKEEDTCVNSETQEYLKPRVIHLRKTRHGSQSKVLATLHFPSGQFLEKDEKPGAIPETEGQIETENLFETTS